ncbi:hypothetical protein RN001_015498 [Aquatica leii]|uniref:Pacifastin domain-containing protein n=1 Tax=Aquatica leii TaxID=1421715 RepID=A0AAN7PPS6_9COLE|nr:hypothetical protein RN001_015498 [Aquatica leii]
MSLLLHACYFSLLCLVFGAQITDIKEEDFDCPQKVMLVENDCNKCYCTSNGELACTLKECAENQGKKLEECEDGTSWLVGCNKCWCIPVGTICTNRTCTSKKVR